MNLTMLKLSVMVQKQLCTQDYRTGQLDELHMNRCSVGTKRKLNLGKEIC